MENKVSDDDLRFFLSGNERGEILKYVDPDLAMSIAADLLATRAALSEINNKLIPEYIEATKRDDAEIQRLTESLSALQ